jgi:Transposase DDE domain group 1
MPTDCSPDRFDFAPVEGRHVIAAFDGGAITSDAGALLLGATDRAIRLVERFATCFADHRAAEAVEHRITTLVGQRIFGIALGYEDLIDHDQLRHDPAMAVLAGKLTARRSRCAPLAGKSTLNRLEHAPSGEPSRYHKIRHDPTAIERLFVELFLEAHRRPPKQIILDLDATDDPIHGHQEGRFFHGYYDCFCYLPLYVFCGRHLLAAKLRRSNIDASAGAVEEVERIVAQIRQRWPRVRVLLRADSGFARDALMTWCEQNRVDYVFGLARNARLEAEIAPELAQAEATGRQSGVAARVFKDFRWTTLDSWSRKRRVVAKAEWTQGGANPVERAAFNQRHLPARGRVRGPASLRDRVLRTRRGGEPDQGMPARPLRRSYFRGDDEGQPAPAVVRVHGLCSALRLAPDRAPTHAIRGRHLRHHPPAAAEDWCLGQDQLPPDQDRHGFGISLPAGVCAGPSAARPRRLLTRPVSAPSPTLASVLPACAPTQLRSSARARI